MEQNQSQNLEKFKIDPELEAMLQQAKIELDSYEKWLKSTGRTEAQIKEALEERKKELIQNIKWKHYFIKKGIPKSWDIWYDVMHTFENAATNNEQLDNDLINAGISHPHHLVALETAKSQKLSTTQLAYVFIRELPKWNFDEIIQFQREKGMTDADIKEAEEYAKEYKGKLETGKFNLDKDDLLEIRNSNF